MNQIKNILYLGWLGKGNVGDEVLYELFKLMFYKYYQNENKKTVVNIDSLSTVSNYKIDVSTYDLIVLGGGSLIQYSYFLSICQAGIENGIPVVSWGTGVDGFYKMESLNSIRFSEKNINDFTTLYEQFDYISVRGAFTKNILFSSGLKKEVHEIGDPALFYASELFGNNLNNNIENRNILINWGTSYNNIFGSDELEVEIKLINVIKDLLSQNYSVIVYPIWTEDIESVKRLAQKVNDPRCQVITEVYEAKVLQKFISEAYLTINFKLHANILSAAANRPFISLAYRGKCYDFANSVNCSEFTLATDEIDSEKILKMVKDIEENYISIVNRIVKAKEKYYPRLRNSFQVFTNILNENSKFSLTESLIQKSDSLIKIDGLKQECLKLITEINLHINVIGNKKVDLNSLETIFNQFINNHTNLTYLPYFKSLFQVSKDYVMNRITSEVFTIYLKNQIQLEKNIIENYLIDLNQLKERNSDCIIDNILLNPPKVTIIVTTYNRKKYLEQAIYSYLNQDYPNKEIIIIDDCSNDGTEEFMNKRFSDERLIKYIRLKENKGPGKNIGNAVQNYADGEFIMIPDDDDYLVDSNYLTKAIKLHLENPNLSFVSADVFYLYTKNNQLNPTHLNLNKITNGRDYFLNFLKNGYPKPVSLVTTVFKRDTLLKMGILEMKTAIDASIYLRSLLVGDAGYINTIAGIYRIHGNNLTFNLSTKFIIETLEEKFAIKKKAVSSYDYDVEEIEKWWENNVLSTFTFYLTNSPESAKDTDMYLWIYKNCRNVLKKIDRKFLDLYWFNQPYSQNVLQISVDLSKTILEGIEHMFSLIKEKNFENFSILLEDIIYAIDTIQNSLESIIQHINGDAIKNRITSTKEVLKEFKIVLTTMDTQKIENILEIKIEPEFRGLNNLLEQTFLPFIIN